MPGKHSYPYSFQIQQPKDFYSFLNFLTMVMAGIGVALVTTYYSNYMPFLSCCSAYIYWLEVFFGSNDRNGKFEYLAQITYSAGLHMKLGKKIPMLHYI